MAITRRSLLLVVCMLGVVLYRPAPLSSCGPFFARAAFTYTVHPDFPLEKFAAGALGVLQPTYARSYLAVAYRYLIGTGFNEAEQKALVALWRERLVSAIEWNPEAWTKVWLEARGTVPGIAAVESINVFRAWGQYSNYVNCLADAFTTAASTRAVSESALASRARQCVHGCKPKTWFLPSARTGPTSRCVLLQNHNSALIAPIKWRPHISTVAISMQPSRPLRLSPRTPLPRGILWHLTSLPER